MDEKNGNIYGNKREKEGVLMDLHSLYPELFPPGTQADEIALDEWEGGGPLVLLRFPEISQEENSRRLEELLEDAGRLAARYGGEEER